MFELSRGVGTRGHMFKLSIPVCRTEVRRRTLSVRCVSLWNSLSAETVETPSLGKFKTRLEGEVGERFFSVL